MRLFTNRDLDMEMSISYDDYITYGQVIKSTKLQNEWMLILIKNTITRIDEIDHSCPKYMTVNKQLVKSDKLGWEELVFKLAEEFIHG